MITETTSDKRLYCPSCNKKAKRVSAVTLRALLKDQFITEIGSGDYSCCGPNGEGCTPITEDTGWRFCDAPACDVVYFSEERDTSFTKSQLIVPVGVKETSGERLLCYCFGHSVASIKDELRTKEHSDALEEIRAKCIWGRDRSHAGNVSPVAHGCNVWISRSSVLFYLPSQENCLRNGTRLLPHGRCRG